MPAIETPGQARDQQRGRSLGLELSAELDEVSFGQLNSLLDLLLDFLDRACQVAAGDIAADGLLAADVFAVDQIRAAGRLGKVGDVFEPQLAAPVRQFESQLFQEIRVRAIRLLELDDEIEPALAFQDFRDGFALQRGLHEVGDKLAADAVDAPGHPAASTTCSSSTRS